MDIGQLCSILAACMSTNPEQRKAGEATLEQVPQHIEADASNRQPSKERKLAELGL